MQIILELREINQILYALGKQPYNEVAGLILLIKAQVEAQDGKAS